MSPLTHYITAGVLEGLDPHPLFNTNFYLRNNPDVAAAGANALHHYVAHGAYEGRDPNPLFDSSWYLAENPDVAAARDNPLAHYLTHGWKEGRDPHPEFDMAWYLERNADVAKSGDNPLVHYVLHGKAEGRKICYSSRVRSRTSDLIPASKVLPPQAEISVSRTEREIDLPPLLKSMLAMFHNDSGSAMLERCYEMLGRYAEIEISESEAARFADVADLIAEIKQMSREAFKIDAPKISVIIPVHNKFIYTLSCIYSLLSVTNRTDFEILVADDQSVDATGSVFGDIGGVVKLVRHEENLGFLKNCNATVAKAAGQIIVLLNNDTLILPNWLEELVKTIERDSCVGLVGSKLLNGDGTLQEAGGIVWNDGSAWNFGRGDDPSAPQYNYVKDVDYISGASIALPKTVWDMLGGFDEIYAPAYCEDTDLAFRVRQAGLRTVFQPFSALIHHEGVSHGRDVTTGIKAYQERNKYVFFNRWKQELEAGHAENGTMVSVVRDRSSQKPHILFIDHYVPQPDRDAGSRTIFGFHVTFWPHNLFFDKPYVMAQQRLGIETIYSWNDIWPSFARWIESSGADFKYAFLSRPHVAEDVIDYVREAGAKILFYGHDIHFKRLAQEFSISGRQEMEVCEEVERRIWPKCDVIYYLSNSEVDFVRDLHPDKRVEIMPTFLCDQMRLKQSKARLEDGQHAPERQCMFIGGFRHRPNVDAMLWFCGEVWPRVTTTIPDAKLVIAGSFPPPEVENLVSDNISVTGAITDDELRQLYDASQVAVVPLRYGAGVKGKFIEALSFGLPVVTTSVGVQGLEDPGRIANVCDDSKEFADALIRLFLDPKQGVAKSLAGLNFVQTTSSLEAGRVILSRSVPELAKAKLTKE
jgi:GT2 family glycosyltransferase